MTTTASSPKDLRHQDTTGPRKHTATWAVGDIISVGSTRWCIRILNGQHVELEAMNVNSGIWWTTRLNQLPEKEGA